MLVRREELMLNIDQVACQAYNSIAGLKGCFLRNNIKLCKRNHELEDCGNGKVCFILGNGPSLNNANPDVLSNYTTFTCNYFFKGSLDIEPTFQVMIDPLYFDREYDYLKSLIREHKNTKFIVPTEIAKNRKFLDLTNEERNRIFFVHTGLKTYKDYIEYDMTKQMTVSMNVLPFAIQCAIYMNFSKIYIIGYEFGLYAPVATGHFYDPCFEVTKPSDTAENLLRGAIVQRHNWAIAQLCAKKNISIVNLTPKSYIKAYPMEDYNKVVKSLGD